MARKFKLKIEELKIKDDDRILLTKMHNHIKKLGELSKKVKNTNSRQIIKTEIREYREAYKYDYATRFYKVTLKLGPFVEEELFSFIPTTEDICYVKDSLLRRISKGRAEKREVKPTQKDFHGFTYDTYGGVFKKPGSVLSILQSEDYKKRIYKPKKPYSKKNHVGVELELNCLVDKEKLNELFKVSNLSGKVYVKHDGSLRVDDDAHHSHEVTVIDTEDNIENTISKVCNVLNSSEVSAYVNDTCGLHVHLDMRNRNVKECYEKLFNAMPILTGMVPAVRRSNQYCRINKKSTYDANFSDMDFNTARRQVINPMSYSAHKTLEVRVHSGSTNATKINNWIKVLLAIINGDGQMITKPSDLAMIGLDNKLIEYVEKRCKKFEDASINTKADHFDLAI